MTVVIDSMNVARGAAGGVVPGSAGGAEHPDSHSHVSSASGSREGSQTSGRGMAQEQRSATFHTWAYLSCAYHQDCKDQVRNPVLVLGGHS